MDVFVIKKNLKLLRAKAMSFLPAKALSCGGLRILMFHSIGGNASDHRLAVRMPASHFRLLLEEIFRQDYAMLTVSEFLKRRQGLNFGKYVVMTLDDGYKDNLLLIELKAQFERLRATLFLSTFHMEGESRKTWHNGKIREYLNWQDVSALNDAGFEIGSHGVNHLALTQLSDTQLRFELEKSRDAIAKNIKKAPEVMSYPYGRFDNRVIEHAKAAGYIGACSSLPGSNNASTDSFRLRRTEIDGLDTLKNFRLKLNGYYD